MENKKDKTQSEDIYSSLKGYFPERYDMTPAELENIIILEKKERDIALGFTDPGRSRSVPPSDSDKSAGIISYYNKKHISGVSAPISEEDEPDEQEEDIFFSGERDELPEESPDKVLPEDTVSFIAEEPEEEDIVQTVPFEEYGEENDLLGDHDTLDVLFDELEAEDTEKSDDVDPLQEKKDEEYTLKVIDWFFDFLEVFTVCMACIILFFSFGARLTMVDGESMEDTLLDGQYLVVSDLFYTPTAGDIVVLQNTSLEYELLREPLVKRIIAVGGEKVRVSYDGTVTITDKYGNNKTLDQSFTKKEPYLKNEAVCEVPEGYVFVMGDNRNNSTDSRDPRVGLVDERCIFGKAYMRILPFDTFTVFENPYSEK